MAARGFVSFYEKLLRRFSSAVHLLTLLPFYGLCILCMGLSIAPAFAAFRVIQGWSSDLSDVPRLCVLGLGLAAAYFVYGLSLIFVVPAMNFILRAKLKAWRGPYHSAGSVHWYIHNGLAYIVRYTFLEALTPSPLNVLYFRMMGMKIGKDVQINSSHISDPSLITIGDKATIGGSAVIIGHYGVGGYLILSPVSIGKGATVGLRAIVMGGAQVGDNARILPNSVVLPKTKIPAGETWGGIPAQKIEKTKKDQDDSNSGTGLAVASNG